MTPSKALSFRRTRTFLRNPMGMFAAALLLAIVIASIFAPWLSPHDPGLVVLSESLESPNRNHLMGTDASGRDVLSRLLWGGRISLQAGTIMVITALVVGVPSGLLAGYHAKWFDGVANWISNMLMSLPQILIIIVVITTLGSSLAPTMITLGILASPDMFRLTRSAVIGVREEPYVEAARVSGLTDTRIIFRHIMSVVTGPVLVRSSFVFGMAIIVQSGLEFLGFGDPSRPSWGGELSTAFRDFQRAPGLVLGPGLAIGITVMALVLVGAALADTLVTSTKVKTKRKKRTNAAVADVDLAGPAADVAIAGSATDAAAGGSAAGVDLAGSAAHVAIAGSSVDPASDAASVPVPPPDALLVVEHLKIHYPGEDGSDKTVVDDVSLHVRRGEVLGLVGESGSGKSQTSFAILGLLPPDATVTSQTLTLDGSSMIGLPEKEMQRVRGQKMAYVPQEPMSNLDPTFTVGTQLIKPLRRKLGLSKKDAVERAIELLERVGIPDPVRTLAAYPHQLSGGMAQRILIAGAVSCDPELLIADEPTTALDVTVQAEVLALLRDLQKERNMGMLIVTHDLGIVADICDRVAVMRHGVLVEQQTVHGLFAEPKHEYTRLLLDSTLEGAAARGPLATVKGGRS